MLFLTVLGNEVKEKKKAILSYAIIIVMVLSGFFGLFMSFDNMAMGTWNSTYTYYENFEDSSAEGSGFDNDTVGAITLGSNPNATWYITTTDGPWDYYTTGVNVSTTQAIDTQSVFFDTDGGNLEGLSFNFTNDTGVATAHAIDYFNYSFYQVGDDDEVYMGLGASFDAASKSIICRVGTDNHISVYELGSWTQVCASNHSTWTNVSIYDIEYGTTFTYNISVEEWGASELYFNNSYSFNVNNSTILNCNFHSGSANDCDFYIDNLEVGSPTEMYTTGGGQGYPTINSTAFNNSLTDVSGNYSITFSSTVNDTILWSNSSGTANETMNITIVDGNESVTYVNITLNNLTDDGSNYLNADDFYLYVYNDSSTNWVNKSSFPTDGGNITLDSSDTDINVTWPITGAETILCRFKLVVSDSQAMVEYTATDFGVYIGG